MPQPRHDANVYRMVHCVNNIQMYSMITGSVHMTVGPDTPVSGHNIPEWSVTLACCILQYMVGAMLEVECTFTENVTLFVPNLTDCQDYLIINYKNYLIINV